MKRTVRLSLGMSFIMLALVLIAPHPAPPKLALMIPFSIPISAIIGGLYWGIRVLS